MASTDTNLSRRQALAGLSVAAGAAATPAAAARFNITRWTDTARWDAALAHYRAIESEHDRRWALHTAADEGMDAAQPREARFFDEYGLGMGTKRHAVLPTVVAALCVRGFAGGLPLWPKEAREAHEAALRAVKADAERITDEFMAYQEQHYALERQFRILELEDYAAELNSSFLEGRDALMAVPAPHVAALLIKMQIGTVSINDDHLDSTLADARRLLGRKA